MEFLKEILGDDLYEQVKTKVSSYNEKADKDKRVSIANVNGDEYVTKAKYSQLKTDYAVAFLSQENMLYNINFISWWQTNTILTHIKGCFII